MGGVVGLAQLAAVMNSRVRDYIISQIDSGSITFPQALEIMTSLNSVGAQYGGIFSLPDDLRAVVTAAFRDGLRWAFISLLPWLGITFALCLFLRKVPEERLNRKSGQTARQQQEEQKKRKEAGAAGV